MNVLDTMKQALEALELLNDTSIGTHAVALPAEIDTAMDALRAAIAEMEKAEPVAWIDWDYGENDEQFPFTTAIGCGIPVYRHPAPAVPEGEK